MAQAVVGSVDVEKVAKEWMAKYKATGSNALDSSTFANVSVSNVPATYTNAAVFTARQG